MVFMDEDDDDNYDDDDDDGWIEDEYNYESNDKSDYDNHNDLVGYVG